VYVVEAEVREPDVSPLIETTTRSRDGTKDANCLASDDNSKAAAGARSGRAIVDAW
jgi:hypothetical protein